jgi:hypothetical protein
VLATAVRVVGRRELVGVHIKCIDRLGGGVWAVSGSGGSCPWALGDVVGG